MAGALVLALTLLHPLAGRAAAAGVTRVSVAAGGAEANGDSMFPTLSADGRVVAFASYASNLVVADGNGVTDVFVRDIESGAVERASVGGTGVEADADSFFAALSADGAVVAFVSFASNLVPGDTNGTADVFVRDRAAGTTERVSVGGGGVEGDAGTYGAPAISADGQVVAFASFAPTLVAGDTNDTADVFVHDRRTGVTERVSVDGPGAAGDSVSFSPAISADGAVVAFVSFAGNLVAGDGNGAADVFVLGTSDTVPPVLSAPPGVTVDATGPDGAVAEFTVSAVDEIDAAPQLTCLPPSGTLFPVGDTTVTCTATDASGNTAAATFTVHVDGAEEQVAGVSTELAELGLPHGTGTALAKKVEQAAGALDAGSVDAACRSLSELQNQLRAQSGKKLSASDAAALSAEVSRIQAVLACG